MNAIYSRAINYFICLLFILKIYFYFPGTLTSHQQTKNRGKMLPIIIKDHMTVYIIVLSTGYYPIVYQV